MCLTFDYVSTRAQYLADTANETANAAMTKLTTSHHGDDTSCDNLQVGIIVDTNGGRGTRVNVISRLPVQSKSAKMAMYNIPTESLGEGDEHLCACDNLSCVAHYLEAWMTPADHIDIPIETEESSYRGLGILHGASRDGGNPTPVSYTRPTFTFPKGKCVADTNGTKFLFKSGTFAQTDAQIATCVESGMYRNKVDYLLSMKDAAWNELKRQLKENEISMSMLFQCTGEVDEDGAEVVEPEAAVTFMEHLYPNLIPGHDILVCLPPVKRGELVMEAAFCVRLSYDFFPTKIAIMGAQHNDVDANERLLQRVDENFYVYSNVELHFGIPSDDYVGTITSVVLHKADAFLPSTNKVGMRNDFVSERVRAQFDQIFQRGEEPDVETWYSSCVQFQNQCREKLFGQLVVDGQSYKLGSFDGTALYATNLVGMQIPCNTTHIVPIEGRDQNLAKRVQFQMSMKRKQTGDPVQPLDHAAVEAALQKALTKLQMKPSYGTEAMITHFAMGQNAAYIKNHNLTLESIDFQAMTGDHKMQVTEMAEYMILTRE